jgi:hypothetical protein
VGSSPLTSGTILFRALIGVVVLGVAFFVWKMWSGRQADRRYGRLKAGADADVHHALQGESFTVGTPSDFTEDDLRGHFRWFSGERARGLRLENPKMSLPSLEGMTFPLRVLPDDAGTWARHPDGNVRLRAYNSDVPFVLPEGLKECDRIRLGDDAEDRVTT